MAEYSQPVPSGAATPVRFPPIARETLANGLGVWAMPWNSVPLVTAMLVLDRGAEYDPAELPGLTGLAADLADEGAGGRNAIELAEAFERLGTHLVIEAASERTVLSFTVLARFFGPALALLGDVLARPHLAERDLERIREQRINRLAQLKTSAGAIADRAFLRGVFGTHPYGHGALGTTRALRSVTLEQVRAFHQTLFVPAEATLIVAGDVTPELVPEIAGVHLGAWSGTSAAVRPVILPTPQPPRVWLTDRPGAPQSELRIGQQGPARSHPDYHAFTTLNAALGGHFTSRINYNLRESKGFTYGARTAFDFRRACSSFSCDTSVQSDATRQAIVEVLREFAEVRSARPVEGAELDQAVQWLTRGYVRQFETPAQLVEAAAELLVYSLDDATFDRFVPEVSRVTADAVRTAAMACVQPDDCVVVVVGDAEKCRADLAMLGREVVEVSPEF